MKETFPPRPVITPRAAQDLKVLETFRETERAWFESLLAHPHVQAVMHIPPDEPIFVLRAQDETAPETVEYWTMTHGINKKKLESALADLDAMVKWQGDHDTKFPD